MPRNRQKTVGRRGETLKRFLIVCEGKQTEPNYFSGFQNELRAIAFLQIEGKGMVSLSLVKEAKKLKDEDGEYEEVWCVFDRDFKSENNNKQNFNEAIKLAQEHKINLAISNDAFELWFLLHYEYYSSTTHRSDLITMLCDKKRLGTKYKKNSQDMYEKLKEKQPDAIRNAKKLWNECDGDYNTNPSTTVFQLVETLNSLNQKSI
jgi:RloB-like protein